MTWEERKVRSEVIGIWVAIVSAVLGGGFALIEYHQHKTVEAADKAMSFVQKFLESPIYDAQQTVARTWTKREKDLLAAAKNGEAAYSAFLLEAIEQEKIEAHVLALMSFFETVATCAKNGWCDRDISASFLCLETKSFWQTHYQYIAAKRKAWGKPELGKSMEDFLKKECTKR